MMIDGVSPAAVGVQGVLYQSPVSAAVITTNTIVFPCTGNEDNETVHAYTWQYNPLSNQPIVIVYDCQVNTQNTAACGEI